MTMRLISAVLGLCAALAIWMLGAGSAAAQTQSWVQIEARPSLAQAEDRARTYAAQLPDVTGYRLSSGWYAIALGPYAPLVAEAQLARLRALGAIPSDSFIADGRGFGAQFWPVGGAIAPVAPLPLPEQPGVTETAFPPTGETLAEARAAERALSDQDRRDVQSALQWAGFYNSTIDGLFGAGTRRSIAAWQAAQGVEPTGVLTTAQRVALIAAFNEARESLGLQLVADGEAGIEINLPTKLVAFDGYEAPFARYAPVNDSGVQVLLISQAGDIDSLASLYEVIQTLEIVPTEGPRRLNRRSFTIEGRDDETLTYITAELADGAIKGFALVWPVADLDRRALAFGAMQSSFRSLGGGALPDTAGTPAAQRPDLISGLRVRQPVLTRSGVWADSVGTVLTAGADLAACGRVTVGEDIEARVAAVDEATGAVVLQPRMRLAPLRVARLAPVPPRLRSEIAVSGFSYGGLLGAPTMTYGTLTDIRSLEGDNRLDLLSISALPGDAGGPVLGASGDLVGLLLPAPDASARALPPDVRYAVDAQALAAFLSDAGFSSLLAPEAAPAMAPEDLVIAAADMTVLVSCWE